MHFGTCRQNRKEECAWHATLHSDFCGYIFANLSDIGDYVSFRAVLGFTNPKPMLLRSPKPVSRPNSITRRCTVSIEPHINSQMLADTTNTIPKYSSSNYKNEVLFCNLTSCLHSIAHFKRCSGTAICATSYVSTLHSPAQTQAIQSMQAQTSRFPHYIVQLKPSRVMLCLSR